jgi:hypothetical protein
MTSRPERPPPTARRVVNASSVLTESEKRIWLEIHYLDGGTEGCTLRPDTFARRLGLQRDTIRKGRHRLKAWELVSSRPRRGYTDAWFATLPAALIPKARGPKDATIFELADALDNYLRQAQPGASSSPKTDANLGGVHPPEFENLGDETGKPGVSSTPTVLEQTRTELRPRTAKDGGTSVQTARTDNSVSQEGETERPDWRTAWERGGGKRLKVAADKDGKVVRWPTA